MPIFEEVAAQQNPGAVAFPTAGTYEMVAQQEEDGWGPEAGSDDPVAPLSAIPFLH